MWHSFHPSTSPFTHTDLADFNEELHRRVLNHPVECLPAFEDAFESALRGMDGFEKVRVHTDVRVTKNESST